MTAGIQNTANRLYADAKVVTRAAASIGTKNNPERNWRSSGQVIASPTMQQPTAKIVKITIDNFGCPLFMLYRTMSGGAGDINLRYN